MVCFIIGLQCVQNVVFIENRGDSHEKFMTLLRVTLLLLLSTSLSLLSPLCRVFAFIYLKQTKFQGYVYAVAALLYLQFVVHIVLFLP